MIELLAPAGDKDSLIAAVQNGANAVYLGGTLFSARASAKNFSNEDLFWAVQYAHERDVKIYVTVNILYNDQEFNELDHYIHYLYDIQVDALIIQDIGLFHFVKEKYPDFELHISTQATVLNSASAHYFETLGAKRVVLAREMSIEQIIGITNNTHIDTEVFVHGALCVCYSGQCLMSSFIGKRSGNRGTCAQPCRLQYTLVENGQLLKTDKPFLLSPKDIMTIHHVGELIDAGVTSFKIEGRMKRPEYVASVVKAYRKAIDAHLNKEDIQLNQEIEDMKSMFNRDYSVGYLKADPQIVNGDYPGNKGVNVGEVVHYNKRNQRVSVKLTQSVLQGDTLVFEDIDKGRPINKIYMHDQLVSKAHCGDTIEIEFNVPVYKGHVRKTNDILVLDKLQKTFLKENTHLPLSMNFTAHRDASPRFLLQYKDFKEEIIYPYNVEEAINVPLTKERIQQQLSKLGQTPFKLEEIQFDIDQNISIPIKIINEIRRMGTDALSQQMKEQVLHHNVNNTIPQFITHHTMSQSFLVEVSSISQLKEALNFDLKEIIYPYREDIEQAIDLCHHKKVKLMINLPALIVINRFYQLRIIIC